MKIEDESSLKIEHESSPTPGFHSDYGNSFMTGGQIGANGIVAQVPVQGTSIAQSPVKGTTVAQSPARDKYPDLSSVFHQYPNLKSQLFRLGVWICTNLMNF